jgi:hypothetical protein
MMNESPADKHFTQNYWDFGLFPLSSISEAKKHCVLETGSVCILRSGSQQNVSPHLRTETDPDSKTLYFLVSRIPDDGQYPKSSTSECYTPSSESPLETFHSLAYKVRTRELLIGKKQEHKCRVLTEEKLVDMGVRLEHTPRNSLKHVAQDTGVSNSSARRATKLLKLGCMKQQ